MTTQIDAYKPEIFCYLLIILGTGMTAMIGLDFFNNRYILSVPYIMFVAIGYVLMRREVKDERRRANQSH